MIMLISTFTPKSVMSKVPIFRQSEKKPALPDILIKEL